MVYYLILCRSLTYAQRTASVLERAGIAARVLRSPKSVAGEGCGYAVKVSERRLAEALVLAGEIHAHNDFEAGSPVALQALADVQVLHEGGDTVLRYVLPACSAARLTLR